MSECKGMSGWFAGPSGENSDVFAEVLKSIYQDYFYWRRNYFPTDGVVVDSLAKRDSEPYWDEFGDSLTELLARLKADLPFYSPRYAAHMVSEQTLPSIAGMFAGLLYNTNNVSSEAAPVTVEMEIEVCNWLCSMLGYGVESWGHITSGGTVANIESLWAARSTLFLPLVVRDVAIDLGLDVPERSLDERQLLALSPSRSLQGLQDCFRVAASHNRTTEDVLRALHASDFNVVERGLSAITSRLGTELVVLAPETCHYCFPKALDVLGLGRDALVRVPVDPHFRLRTDALEDAILKAEQSGKTILAVVGVAGTTEEGAIDPLHEIVSLRDANAAAGKSEFWIHADAAYGGYLRTMILPHRIGLGSPEVSVKIDGKVRNIAIDLPLSSACDALESLSMCDSVAIDPHKLGYVPYPAGAVCFKSDLVKPVLRQDAPYIGDEMLSPSQERRSRSVGLYVLEGSKPGMVAAALWLSHKLIPLDCDGHGRLMRETIRNAGEMNTLLRKFPELSRGHRVRAVPLCPPGSNVVCFAFVPTGAPRGLRATNAANRAVFESMSAASAQIAPSSNFFVSRTVLSRDHYRWETVSGFVESLGGTREEFEGEGVFVLRSVLMNPWYGPAKAKGRYFLCEFVAALYDQARIAYGL